MNLLELYLVLALLIGLVYAFNWYRNKKPVYIVKAAKSQKIGAFMIAFIMGSIFAPLSVYDLIKDKNKRS